MFQCLGEEIWGHEMIVWFGGIPLPHRMTIIRLGSGRLFVHSPTKLDSMTQGALATLGPVDSIIGPSWWHDLFLREWVAAYPNAKLYGEPALVKSNPSFPFTGILDSASAPWDCEIARLYVDRMLLFLNEVVFFHHASRSLIVADLAFNTSADSHWFTKLSFAAAGAYPGCKIPWFYRLAGARNRDYLRAKIEKILDWNFEQLVVGHGAVVPKKGKDALREAYGWLLG